MLTHKTQSPTNPHKNIQFQTPKDSPSLLRQKVQLISPSRSYHSKSALNHTQTKDSLDNYKVSLCSNWANKGSCPYNQKCRFAHGVEQLRCVDESLYKTKACIKFLRQHFCPYGFRCNFTHETANCEEQPTCEDFNENGAEEYKEILNYAQNSRRSESRLL